MIPLDPETYRARLMHRLKWIGFWALGVLVWLVVTALVLLNAAGAF